MDENIGVMLKCRVCLGEYNETSQKPLLLPACGHTFCAMCLKLVQAQGNVGCPECRKNNAVTSVDTLPVNFSVLSLAQAVNKSRQPQTKMNQTQAKANNSSMKQKVSVKKSSHPYSENHAASPSYEKRRNKQESNIMPANTSAFGAAASIISSAEANLPPSQPISHTNPPILPPNQPISLTNQPVSPPNQPISLTNQLISPTTQTILPPNQPISSTSSHNIVKSDTSMQNVKSLVSQPTPSDLQDELDFQMAIHLTFCKDPNHRHDEPLSPVYGRRDSLGLSEDEQLKLALQMSRDEMFKN